MKQAGLILLRFLPFWLFLAVFKFGGGLHYTLLVPYGSEFLPIWVVGVLVGTASFVQLVLDIPAGYMLDRYGYLPALRITTFAFLIASICLAVGLTELTFILSLGFGAFGWLFYGPGGSAYILAHTTDAESGRYFSLRDTFASIGIVCASVALPFVILLNPQTAGLILCGLFVTSLAILLFVKPDRVRIAPQHHPYTSRRRTETLRKLWSAIWRLNPASGMLTLLTFSGAFFYASIWFILPLVIAAEQAHAGTLGIGLGIFDFSVVMLGYFIGTLVDRADKRIMVFFGLLMFAVFGTLVGFNFGWLFILFGFLTTAGDEVAGISLWSWLHLLDKDHAHDGTIAGVITFSEDLGWTLGPMAAGALFMLLGPSLAIAFSALPIFIVWVVYYAKVHHHFPLEAVYSFIPHHPRRRRHKS